MTVQDNINFTLSLNDFHERKFRGETVAKGWKSPPNMALYETLDLIAYQAAASDHYRHCLALN